MSFYALGLAWRFSFSGLSSRDAIVLLWLGRVTCLWFWLAVGLLKRNALACITSSTVEVGVVPAAAMHCHDAMTLPALLVLLLLHLEAACAAVLQLPL